MNALLRNRWSIPVLIVLVVVLGGLLVSTQLPDDLAGALIGGGLALILVVQLLRIGLANRHDHSWEQARQGLADGKVVVLWKPGCRFCARLRRELGEDRRFLWLNVYRDDEGDRVVRSVNGGDQLTPTVLIPAELAPAGMLPAEQAPGALASADREPATNAAVLRNPSAAELDALLVRPLGQ